MATDAIKAPDELPPEWRDAVLRHLDELGIRFVPLDSFVDDVMTEMDGDYWPAPATFEESAWTEAEERWAHGDR